MQKVFTVWSRLYEVLGQESSSTAYFYGKRSKNSDCLSQGRNWGGTGKSHEGTSWNDRNTSNQDLSIEVWVVQEYAVFKTRSVHFILCKLHLKKLKAKKKLIRSQKNNGREASLEGTEEDKLWKWIWSWSPGWGREMKKKEGQIQAPSNLPKTQNVRFNNAQIIKR